MKPFARIVVVLLIFCFSCWSIGAAETGTGNHSEMEQSAAQFLSRVNLRLWMDDGQSRGIQCFDVKPQEECGDWLFWCV